MKFKIKSVLLFVLLFTFQIPKLSLFAQDSGINFTDQERNWLANHQVLKVANELDWPPFDFAENDEPRGYSIDLFKLAAKKLQLKYEFVNGYSWAEIMDLFRDGKIDILPAIYSTEERLELINFTKSYASNPSILVVNKKFTSISNLDDLKGKTVAVISGYATAKALEDRHPEIERTYVKDVMDGLQKVSVGNVDAFIGSLGIITYLTEQNFISNIKIVGDVGLKKKIETELHMGVSKDNTILRDILQKGLDAISHKDMRGIRQAWFPIEVADYEDTVSYEYMSWYIILPILLVLILLVFGILKKLKPQKKYTILKFGIAAKILVLLLTVAILAVGIIGFISYNSGREVLEEELFDKLTAVREMKSDQIEDHFDLINNQILTFSKDRMIIEAMNSFNDGLDKIDNELNLSKEEIEKINKQNREYFNYEFKPRVTRKVGAETGNIIFEDDYWEGDVETQLLQNLYIVSNKNETGSKDLLINAGDGSSYSKAHQIYHPIIRDYLKKFEYYDIFLVDYKTGHIVYSVFKEVDFGTNLLNGPYSQTNIAEAFVSASKNSSGDYSKIVDFEPYLPSYNAPAAFISSPIIDNKKIIGILIFQMPIDAINDIMTNKNEWLNVGLGLTGETYLVGDDYLMRNQSRFLIEDSENYFEMLNTINIPKETINKIKSYNSSIGLQPVKTIGVEAALRGETGTKIFFDYRGVAVLSSYMPLTIQNVNYVIMSEMDEEEAFEGVYSLRTSILLWFAGIIIFIVVLGVVFAKSITRPISELTESARKLAEGNLDVKINVAGTDEIGMLAGNFNSMRRSLKELINSLEESNLNLEKKVKERTQEIQRQQELLEIANKRMKGELDIGKEIQMSMLPLIFPAFPNRTEFAVYANLIPAREVGGDFYDFFFIDEDRFCFVIGDVSGKGVPAALFMAVTKTLIKSRASSDFSTASILSHVNKEMSSDNKSSMFVTVFACIMNIRTGELVYTNAGHNPPFIKREDNTLERLGTLHGPIIGAVEDLTYKESMTTLSPGEGILLYTDGVTEAMDIGNNLFSEKRLVEHFSSSKYESVENIVNSIVEVVKQFEGEVDQADDITILAFKYLGKQDEKGSMVFDITIKNGLPAIEQVKERFDSFADVHNIDVSIRRKMYIVFDEFLNNIISYAYNDNHEHNIDINVKLIKNHLAVTIIDDGIPFDPFSSKSPDTDSSLDEREIGGLGIHLVRNMMDKVSYQRKDDKNIVKLIKSLNP
jgi:serine phosphatase RsbU (regulator of sigma subunit)/ABC-type amino acid transport substrate-binding protein/anti-sigma regulatory factor (Ser/Thr protein kinase)